MVLLNFHLSWDKTIDGTRKLWNFDLLRENIPKTMKLCFTRKNKNSSLPKTMRFFNQL